MLYDIVESTGLMCTIIVIISRGKGHYNRICLFFFSFFLLRLVLCVTHLFVDDKYTIKLVSGTITF